MRLLLTLLALLLPLSSSAQLESVASLNRGLVGRWDFSSGTGTNAYDISGQRNTGTLQGSTLPVWTNGVFGGAVYIAQTNSNILVADNPSLSFTNNIFSISYWVKFLQINPYLGIVGKRGNPWEYSIYTLGSSLLFTAWNGSGSSVYTSSVGTNLLGTNWMHFAWVTDGAFSHVYLNGKEQGTPQAKSGLTMSDTSVSLLIGAGGAASGVYSTFGILDDVRIYNRALSSNEVYNLFSQGCVHAGLTP